MSSRRELRTQIDFLDVLKRGFDKELNTLTMKAKESLKSSDSDGGPLYKDLVHFYMESLEPLRRHLRDSTPWLSSSGLPQDILPPLHKSGITSATTNQPSTGSASSKSPSRNVLAARKQEKTTIMNPSDGYTSDSSYMPRAATKQEKITIMNPPELSDGYTSDSSYTPPAALPKRVPTTSNKQKPKLSNPSDSCDSTDPKEPHHPPIPVEDSRRTEKKSKPPTGSPELVTTTSFYLANEKEEVQIYDIKLLSDEYFVVCDNRDVKLFNMKAELISSCSVKQCYHLAVLNPESNHTRTWKVAVTTTYSTETIHVVLLEVTPPTMKHVVNLKISEMSLWFFSAEFIDSETLAVARVDRRDVIYIKNITDGSLHHFDGTESLCPRRMTATGDGHLMMTTNDKTVAKVNLSNKSIVFNKKVPEIGCPTSIAMLQDGHILISDYKTKSLHLIAQNGCWIKKWTIPAFEGFFDCNGVCISGDLCLAWTDRGKISLLDIDYT